MFRAVGPETQSTNAGFRCQEILWFYPKALVMLKDRVPCFHKGTRKERENVKALYSDAEILINECDRNAKGTRKEHERDAKGTQKSRERNIFTAILLSIYIHELKVACYDPIDLIDDFKPGNFH